MRARYNLFVLKVPLNPSQSINQVRYLVLGKSCFCGAVACVCVRLQAVIEQGGIQPGGLNFDAKIRRESTDVIDLFISHIGLPRHMSGRVC